MVFNCVVNRKCYPRVGLPSLLSDSPTLKGTSTSTKNDFKSQEITITVKLVYSILKDSVCIQNKFKNRLFLFSTLAGAAILNNCDVLRLPYCY